MQKTNSRQTGSLMIELIIAIAILLLAAMPLAYSFVLEHKLAANAYQRAAAMEIIDGEMEILAAGGWRDFKPGAQTYPLHGEAAKNLPPGKATLTITGKHLRLDWKPDKKTTHGEILREVDAP